MGTVHGVYLKYVGLSALSYAGYSYLLGGDEAAATSDQPLQTFMRNNQLWRVLPVLFLGYSTLLNGLIAVLFKLEAGMALLGKDPKRGTIPLWSYILYAPFHLPTYLYTHIHTLHGTYTVPGKDGEKPRKEHVPVASKVQPGWYVGGCYAHQLNKEWASVIDLTVEFPESCINTTKTYMSKPTWDGVPATPEQLEEAAIFAVTAQQKHGGDVLVHCAHGRGRSTTVMCACLVKAGLFKTWEEAFEKGIKPGRPVCKLNTRMQQNLTAWQAKYVDKQRVEDKKEQ
ncbi:Dual specificity protein phosphatase Diacylglycerol kinase, catalytic region [Seminavis robusta]|uniref:Dual specificity protein phosphatase Diacylglycerol kinase, catalytic region n=1 Tax=Seminavis robusta TaxID=568900 RepID=A0A9N8HNL2_9STRA|nr:Dual specificity protein phosphatase Diacylglycerol kinase, catalytic region [Seminavis robusta]|eukprot:Sro1095_g240640.1 Dual specificity protein phosphatase Diacylglycerol kinase, catalytic region (284) ;mRNA; f:7422-8273